MDKKWNEYARAAMATYSYVQRGWTEGNGRGKVIADSAEPFFRRRVEDTVKSARQTAEPWDWQKRER